LSNANGCSGEGEYQMLTIATYLRDHAHELSDLAQECKDSAASNRLERISWLVIEKAKLIERAAPPLEA
jgi:hypothetical protein